MAERRIDESAPLFYFSLIERGVILGGREVEDRMVGQKSLDDHFAGQLGASSSTCHLRKELENLLGGAEVGDAERGVCVEDADKRNGGEMKSLCDHLRADEDVGFVSAELFEEVFMAIFLRGGVAVHPESADFREDGVERALDVLGAKAFELEGFRGLALGAGARSGLLIIAEMALQ